MNQTLYLNNSSTLNNKYFDDVSILLKYPKSKIKEIKEYKQRTNYLKNSNSKLGRGYLCIRSSSRCILSRQ